MELNSYWNYSDGNYSSKVFLGVPFAYGIDRSGPLSEKGSSWLQFPAKSPYRLPVRKADTLDLFQANELPVFHAPTGLLNGSRVERERQ